VHFLNTPKTNIVKTTALNTIANRIRYLRNLTGLTRDEVAEYSHITKSALEKWENGTANISARNVTRLINMAADQSIACTAEWLLHGEGHPPKTVVPSSLSEHQASVGNTIETALRDLNLFKMTYPQGLTLMITDDAMADYYVSGDFVGGLSVDLDKLKQYLNYACIVQTADGKTRLRRIGCEDGSWFLYGTNTRHNGWPYLEKDVKIAKVAPVFWHRLKL
jgi:transcriptional regulator with XRE-family HTH domain